VHPHDNTSVHFSVTFDNNKQSERGEMSLATERFLVPGGVSPDKIALRWEGDVAVQLRVTICPRFLPVWRL
jgi:hypothetical protein